MLPIWVGIFEANAIALQIENISTPRPMTHDLLRNVIHDLKASVQKIVVCDLQENTFYALIYLRAERRAPWRSTRGRATRSRWRCGRARRSSSRNRSSTTPRRSISSPEKADTGPAAEVAREPRPGRSRQIQDVGRRVRSRLLESLATPPAIDDRRHRQPEGRRGQDHDRHQPGRRAGAARQADAAHRSRPPGQQHDVVSRHAAGRRGASTTRSPSPTCRAGGRHPAVAARESVDRAVADRAGQARGEAGGGDGRAFPAEGQARAAPRGRIRRSSSTARRRSAC